LSQTNIIPNEVFSDQVEATKLAIANDVVLSSYSKMIDNLLLMKVSVEVRKEMFSILEKIEQSSDNAERLELVQKLQVITSTQIVNNE
jgi:hypothetical protein